MLGHACRYPPTNNGHGTGVHGFLARDSVEPEIKQSTVVFSRKITTCGAYPKRCFFKFFKGVAYVQFTIHSAGGSGEAPKTAAPRVATPTPQQNQGDKPAPKSSEQRK
jgi:hypothetical protein